MKETRRCSVCGETKELSEFGKRSDRPGGYRYQCKACDKAYRMLNAEEANAKRAKRRKEHNAEFIAREVEYRKEHREGLKQYQAEYHAAHLEEAREQRLRYAEMHPDRIKQYHQNYKESEYGKNAIAAISQRRRTPGGIKLTSETVAELKAEYGGYCPYCNQKIENGHIDHIVPISSGGTNERDNLVYCCDSCNLSKGSKSLLEFMIYRIPSEKRIAIIQ